MYKTLTSFEKDHPEVVDCAVKGLTIICSYSSYLFIYLSRKRARHKINKNDTLIKPPCSYT